ncbi:CYTH and CHAD domain-containing protein [Nakamurella flava]|uniref:CYTH and CHAD domain-containing protein n=1 Tax=Nakamurella flava TaxID=2576308 RepID=A0A4U6QGL6_9ACTN|nr:CYTH and CHAD domain-containing protein [Nakamurella flava]TKV59202.1 CYTH and CHAD domain-containing protein [Nakamurella flava]
MTATNLEVEQKFDVDADTAWPDLADVPGVARVDAPDVTELVAVYYDTADLRLARVGVTLRRRTGGDDAGWHLKVPAGAGAPNARTEYTEPMVAGRAADPAGGPLTEPPTALLALVPHRLRGAAVAPIATLTTTRTRYRLLDADGALIAEAVDDVVDSVATVRPDGATGEARIARWREWEIELADGADERGDELLAAVADRLLAAGARSSKSGNKLEQALGGGVRRRRPSPVPAADGRAGDVLHAHLIEQIDALLARDPEARRDEPDGVHKMRVATRRLRSALATYRPLLDREVTDPIRDELKWIAGELGGPRDAEVLRERLIGALSQEPDDLVFGPIAARITETLQSDHRSAHDELLVALDSDRYWALLDALDELAQQPPFTELAGQPADEVITARVRKAFRRVRALVDAGEPEGAEHRDEWFHEIRKAAKRLRYAAESAAPAFGEKATALATAAEDLQEVLGEHQDSVVARQVLRDMAARFFLDGENTFSIGRLHAREQYLARDMEERFPQVWSAVSHKKLRRWLKG